MTVPTVRRVKRYASVILRWLIIGTVVFFATMLTGLYITDNVLPKVYMARSTMRLPPGDLVTPTPGLIPESVTLQPEFENVIQSPEFLLAVIKNLGLEKEWAKRLNSDQDELPDVDALTRMEKLVKFSIDHGTNLVEITAASDVPGEAAAIANAIADHYKTIREAGYTKSLVRVIIRAETPAQPAKPNKSFAFMVSFITAIFLSLTAASFVEMILLFIRAGERNES